MSQLQHAQAVPQTDTFTYLHRLSQVIACAADWYSVDKRRSKRELQVIWGAILQLFVLFPTFKHFRVLNVAALVRAALYLQPALLEH